jgi:hypothetical protein
LLHFIYQQNSYAQLKSNKKNQQNMTFALGEAKRKEHA